MIPVSTKSKQHTETPDWLFHWLHKRFNFLGDVAASARNAKLACYIDRYTDALKVDWYDCNFCNPPFKKIGPWVDKALEQAFLDRTSVLLLPNSVACGWYKRVYRWCETELLTPRFAYKNAGKGVPFGSMLLIFTPETANNPRPDRIKLVDLVKVVRQMTDELRIASLRL